MKEAQVVNCFLDPVLDCNSICPFYPEMVEAAESIASGSNITVSEAVMGVRKVYAALEARRIGNRIVSTFGFLEKQGLDKNDCVNFINRDKRV